MEARRRPAQHCFRYTSRIADGQVREALLVCTGAEPTQEPQRMRRALGPRLQMQPTQIAEPSVVVVHEIAVKGFERGRRRVGDRPSSVHQPQQHSDGAGVSMAPIVKWQRGSRWRFRRADIVGAETA